MSHKRRVGAIFMNPLPQHGVASMNQSRKLLLMLSMGMALTAGAEAAAQEQTVENAQKFIALALPDNRYITGYLIGVVDEARKGGGASLNGTAKISDASALGRCRSRILFDLSGVTIEGWPSGRPSQSKTYYLPELFPDAYPQWGTNKEGFSWGEVTDVKAEGSEVALLFKGNTIPSRIYLGAESMASRVAYAIEFLRLNCDVTADTGF